MSVTVQDIRAARHRIAPFAVQTPLISSPRLDDRVGGRMFLKAECLQTTGSFKLRGATNAVLQLPQGCPGVVAYSSGNHAQAVALAARRAGLPAVIVMPADAPQTKRDRTAAYGADVVLYDRATESREAIGEEIADRRGLALIPPYDHPRTIAGQGTVGLEACEQMAAAGAKADQVLICCSGGGLAAGVGLAVREAYPACQIITVEPEGHDDMARSLAGGERVANQSPPASICDALLVPTPGELTFAILKELGARGVSVSDDDARAAMSVAIDELRVVLEPGGAVALAASLFSGIASGRTSLVILSGGNADRAAIGAALA